MLSSPPAQETGFFGVARNGAEGVMEAYAQAAESIRRMEPEIIDILAGVATRHAVQCELDSSVATLEKASSEAVWIRSLPRSLDVSVFLPSNNLLYSYVLYGLMPTGWPARVRLRPSSRVKGAYRALHSLLAGVLGEEVNLVEETQRDFVARAGASDLVVFTGSPDNGRAVARALSDRCVLMGLGSGPNPMVVGPLADIERAVRDTVEARLYNGGQDCLCPDVVMVHVDRMAEFEDRLVAELESVPPGEGTADGLVNSPLVYPDAHLEATEWIRSQRPHVRWQATAADLPRFVPSTVVRAPSVASARVAEHFAPVFHLVPYTHPSEILRWAQEPENLEHGFYISVYGEPGLEDPVIGTAVNTGPRSALDFEDGNTPFGGYGSRASWISTRGKLWGTPVLASREVAVHVGRS